MVVRMDPILVRFFPCLFSVSFSLSFSPHNLSPLYILLTLFPNGVMLVRLEDL